MVEVIIFVVSIGLAWYVLTDGQGPLAPVIDWLKERLGR